MYAAERGVPRGLKPGVMYAGEQVEAAVLAPSAAAGAASRPGDDSSSDAPAPVLGAADTASLCVAPGRCSVPMTTSKRTRSAMRGVTTHPISEPPRSHLQTTRRSSASTASR